MEKHEIAVAVGLSSILVVSFLLYLGQGWIFCTLPYVEVGGELGWNVVGVVSMITMAVYGFYVSWKIMKPIDRKNVIKFVATPIVFLLFFYTLVDIFPRIIATTLVYAVRGLNFSSVFIDSVVMSMANPPPSNLVAFLVYFGFSIMLAWKYVKKKPIVFAFLLTAIISFIAIFFFGDYNMRLMEKDARILFYYTIYMPVWVVWVSYFFKSWKKPEPTEFEKYCMGD